MGNNVVYTFKNFQQSMKTKSIAEELELSTLKISHSLNELKKEVSIILYFPIVVLC